MREKERKKEKEKVIWRTTNDKILDKSKRAKDQKEENYVKSYKMNCELWKISKSRWDKKLSNKIFFDQKRAKKKILFLMKHHECNN
jgi:ribosomal protein L1